MGQLVMCSGMVDCHLLMYYLMGHIPATYRAYFTGGHYHPPPKELQDVFPVIHLAT